LGGEAQPVSLIAKGSLRTGTKNTRGQPAKLSEIHYENVS